MSTSIASISIRYTDEEGVEHHITKYADEKLSVWFNGMKMCGNITIYECKNAENILLLSLCRNQITGIVGLGLDHLTNLQKLYLDGNRITKIGELGLDHLTKLQVLYLGNNQITEIKCLDHLTNLQIISLHNNHIKEIRGLDHFPDLQELWLSGNEITEINGLGLDNLTNLQVLYLSHNQITKINGLDHLTNLQKLYLGHNNITEIGGLDHLPNLQNLWLDSNKITEIPLSIMNLRNLQDLYITNCQINQIIRRFLDRNNIKNKNTPYTDGQNVHDSQIVKSVQESIYAIIQDVKQSDIDTTLNDILKDDIVSKRTKAQLVEYCEDKTVHSLLNLTFGEILVAVWKVIMDHKDSKEIKEILNGEMSDSMCKCFTGRISRLVNSLNGFDDRIDIKISDSQEILNVIINVKNKYTNIDKQKNEIIKELTDRGYDMTTINEYIVYLE
jgi:Leucine-rich repeat (LRR) protein